MLEFIIFMPYGLYIIEPLFYFGHFKRIYDLYTFFTFELFSLGWFNSKQNFSENSSLYYKLLPQIDYQNKIKEFNY